MGRINNQARRGCRGQRRPGRRADMGGDPMEHRPVGVAVIDDHQVVIDGVRAWAAADPAKRVNVVLSGATTASLIPRPDGIDVVLLDLELNGELVLGEVATLSDA